MVLLAIKLLVDSIMVMLLGATIYYCFIVNKRIKVLQDSKEEFAQIITQFDESTRKAQESVEELQRVSQRVTESLNERLDKANFLADDLAFMIEKGNKTADKVFNNLSKEEKMDTPPVPPRRDSQFDRQRQERDRAVVAGGVGGRPAGASSAARESIMRVAGGANNGANKSVNPEDISPAQARRPSRVSARPRSKAEEELQKALRSGSGE